MKYAYANKKFKGAVTEMATSPKNIQERIGDAFINHLIHLEIEELPKKIRLKFSDMFQRLTKYEAVGNKGSVQATIDQISTDEAIEIAGDIVYMADILYSKLSDL
ncbi:MAG: hypothetical protein DRG80_04850 [Deltaproteobacteria bacterium]|nr:MAG: hypothetical protein DRG80_04850 [Deltaproteobacteria bacterium]